MLDKVKTFGILKMLDKVTVKYTLKVWADSILKMLDKVNKLDTLKVSNNVDTLKVLDVMGTLKVSSKMNTLKVLNKLGTIEVSQQGYLLEKCNVLARGMVKEEWCGPMGWEVRYHLMGLQDKVGRLEDWEVRYQFKGLTSCKRLDTIEESAVDPQGLKLMCKGRDTIEESAVMDPQGLKEMCKRTGRHRGVSHGYGPERRQVQGHRTVPSGLRDQSQRRGHRQDDGSPLERVPMGVQQYEMRRQMPREASRQPQGEVQGGSTRTFVDDVNQQGKDERDELRRALEQSMVEELHRQKLEMEKQKEEMKKYAEDLQRQRDEFEKKNEELQKELKKKSSSVEPPRTPPRRPQYYSLSPRTTPGGTQVPPGQPPLEVADLPELPPWQFDPFAVDEHVGGGTGFDGLEDFWTPVDQQPQQQHHLQPGADRFAWLDREVRMMHGERPRLTGEYWEQPVHRHGGPPADFGYVPQPPPQPPQGHGVGPYGGPMFAAPMSIWFNATAMAATSTTSKRS